MIAERGFLRTTISEIAAAAGKSSASFYNYYDSKEDLLEELADEFAHDTELRQAEHFPATTMQEWMYSAAAAYWNAYKDHLAELVGVFQTAMLDDRFADRWRAIRVVGIEPIRDSIEQAQANGYCPDIDPWMTAAALGSMFEHFCYVSLAQGGAFSDHPVDDEAAIAAMATILFRSIFWKPSAGPGPKLSGRSTASAAELRT